MLNAKTANMCTLIAIVSTFMLFTACNSSGENSNLSSFEIRLYDAPLDSAQEVNIFIERVEINTGDGESWSTISSPEQTFNLLDLTNGNFEVIGDTLLEPGVYSQIRLILSEDGHSLVMNDSTYALRIPSGAQTGLKLNVQQELEADTDYVLLLDFDVAKSIVQRGNVQNGIEYQLKPVIRVNFQSQTGNISGIVEPAEARPIIYAIQDADTLASTIADTLNGEFKLIGLTEGAYRVSIEPRTDNYTNLDINDVEVNLNETTDLGLIELNENNDL